MYKSSMVLASILISLTNFWIWRILKVNILFGLTLVLLNVSLIYLVYIRFDKKIFLMTVLLVLMISYQILVSGFDQNLAVITPDQQSKLNERHGYFATDLGIFFQNKFSLHLYKDIYPYINVYSNNIFNSLSPNLYFFSNHPREREKIEEFAKFPSILIVPFLVGLVYLFTNFHPLMLMYFIFVLVVTGFVKQTYFYGPILFFPMINLLITIGFLKIYTFFKR